MTTKDQLIDYLISKEIPDNLDSAEESKIVSELFSYCWDLTPEKLFRYRTCNEYSFEALENDKFLLTKPILFNDPYDSLLFIDRQKIIQTLTQSGSEDEDLIHKLKNDLEFRKSQIEKFGHEFVNRFLKVEPFKTREEKESYKKFSNKIYEKFNDEIIEEAIKSLKQSSLVACLSERFDSILMWSHYSQNHEGFALNYNFKELYSIDVGIPGIKGTEFSDKKLFPVRYSKERFDATYYAEFHFIFNYYRSLGLEFNQPFFDKLFYYKILLFKSSDWDYEKEWRIIKLTNLNYEDNKPNFGFIGNIRPKEIYLGANINKENKERLIKIGKLKNVDVFQMKLESFQKNISYSV